MSIEKYRVRSKFSFNKVIFAMNFHTRKSERSDHYGVCQRSYQQ